MRDNSASPLAGTEASQRKKATFNLDATLHYRLKVAAAKNRREMGDLVEEALTILLARLERTRRKGQGRTEGM